MSHESIAYELERELVTYSSSEDEAVLIAASKEVQKIFLQKELQKNIPFQVYFTDEEAEKYAIIRFGTRQEMMLRKNS